MVKVILLIRKKYICSKGAECYSITSETQDRMAKTFSLVPFFMELFKIQHDSFILTHFLQFTVFLQNLRIFFFSYSWIDYIDYSIELYSFN
jgi:hypothetical protein